MRMRFHIGALCLIALFAVSSINAGEPIRIGVMGPVTGAWASEGQSLVNAVTILAEEVNAAGGINGRPLSIEVGD